MADHLVQHGRHPRRRPGTRAGRGGGSDECASLGDCPPDGLTQDGSHHGECLQSQKRVGRSLRRTLLAATPAPALDVEALYRARLAVENHGAPVVPTDDPAIAAEYARIVNEEAR